MSGLGYTGIEETLGRLIRLPTVHSTDDYHIAEYRDALRAEFPAVFGRAAETPVGEALLLELAGQDPAAEPVLFTSHMDVVAAGEADGWPHPPFSGHAENGKIWGRGSLDMKGTQCALLAALNGLLAGGWQPRRRVYLYFSCDEEVGGATTALAAQRLEENGVTLEAVFDEGGTLGENFLDMLPGPCAQVAIAEKGALRYDFTARGPGGHAAFPPEDSAIVRLARFAADVWDKRYTLFRRELTAETRQTMTALCEYLPADKAAPLREALAETAPGYPLLRAVLPDQAESLLGATIAFTIIRAGTAPNVLPKTATLTANVRVSSVQGEEEVTGLLRRKAAEYGLECVCAGGNDAPPPSGTDCPAYRAVVDSIGAVFGAVPVIPVTLAGGTDSKHFSRVARSAIRFTPITIVGEQGKGVHGAGEYLTVESLAQAAEFYEHLLANHI